MKHERFDYFHIQDTSGKIEKKEPVFLFRAKDELSADVLDFYADLLEDNEFDKQSIQRVRNQAHTIRTWQNKNKDKVRLPDF